MRKFILIILIILPIVFWAQQSGGYQNYKIGNVTVRFFTGTDSEEINNAKIIGQYAAILSDSMSHEKPILLDFIQEDYSNHEETSSHSSYGKDKYEIIKYQKLEYEPLLDDSAYTIVFYSDINESSENVEKDVYAIPAIDESNKIVIRQFGFHFDLTETMNLLYYALNNQSQVQNLTKSDTLFRDSSEVFYRLGSIPQKYIDSIISTPSHHLDQLLDTKIYRDMDTMDRRVIYYSYFLQQGKYIIFAGLHGKETVLDTLDKIYSFNPTRPEALFVFETPTQFSMYKLNPYRFPEISGKQFKKHIIPIDPNEFTLLPNIEWLGEDIYLINYYRMYEGWRRFPYLEKEDVLIEDFEEFINSYRKGKN